MWKNTQVFRYISYGKYPVFYFLFLLFTSLTYFKIIYFLSDFWFMGFVSTEERTLS